MSTRSEQNNSNYPAGTVGFKASNGTTEVAVIAAPASGKRLRLTSIQLASLDDAVQLVTFRNGNSGATFYSIQVAKGAADIPATRDINFGPGGFVLDPGKALMAALGEASITTVAIGASADVLDVTP